MAIYTIIATVTKLENDEIKIKGVGKHLYPDSSGKEWNVFEEEITENSKMVKTDENIKTNENAKTCAINTFLLATAMVNRKPLKFAIDKEQEGYTIKSVSVCDD